MKRRKHKRRLNHVLILTSDAADANVKQFRVRAWIVEVVVFPVSYTHLTLPTILLV